MKTNLNISANQNTVGWREYANWRRKKSCDSGKQKQDIHGAEEKKLRLQKKRLGSG